MNFKSRYEEYNKNITANYQLVESVLDSYRENNTILKRPNVFSGRIKYVACLIGVLALSGTVFAAGNYIKQREITYIDSEEEMQEFADKNQLDSIAVSSELYDSDIFKNATEECIDRVDSMDYGKISMGGANNKWSRKCVYKNTVSYDYDSLSLATEDQGVGVNFTELENTYQLWNEKGCSVGTNPDGSLLSLLIYGGYIDKSNRIITVCYIKQGSELDAPYIYAEGKIEHSFVKTVDGAKVLLEYQKGTAGDHRIIATVTNDTTMLDVIFYGEFTYDEIMDMMNSMELGKEFGSAD